MTFEFFLNFLILSVSASKKEKISKKIGNEKTLPKEKTEKTLTIWKKRCIITLCR